MVRDAEVARRAARAALVLALAAGPVAACGTGGGPDAAPPSHGPAARTDQVPPELQKAVNDAETAAQQGEREMADQP
ncbi:hypothetical protein BTM25_11340 [Actinomadura rubteroloni]|uniref:Uncharacterized protein n=1 Tax=Actinomadura rubteroloni TaxID=1926885 RepID=A0A2P4UNV4_9ACTN|nr:hypothetical protein [Actinomadura rubteroloni]POM26728.1 hypothetical protein BTM25_11340 [Actinomadura rubteroloni]